MSSRELLVQLHFGKKTYEIICRLLVSHDHTCDSLWCVWSRALCETYRFFHALFGNEVVEWWFLLSHGDICEEAEVTFLQKLWITLKLFCFWPCLWSCVWVLTGGNYSHLVRSYLLQLSAHITTCYSQGSLTLVLYRAFSTFVWLKLTKSLSYFPRKSFYPFDSKININKVV